MGVTALPPRERVTILARRLVREGVLQQSSLSRLDASCDPDRAAALADAALAVAGRCQELAGRGVPPAAIEDQDSGGYLASLYERCGRIRGRPGSLTLMPVLTMPAGDITHPVPDLTGYITEGQVVLSPELHARGIYPPVDELSSLTRLMRRGAGPGRTRADHLDVAAQTLAALASARRAGELAELIGIDALSASDRRYQQLERTFQNDLVNQDRGENRTLEETLRRAWRVLGVLPQRDLPMLPAAALDAYYPDGEAGR
jgi:vacuolar-type H+-ATPase subunit B/Vma2